MLLNCGFGEDSWESLGWQVDQTNQSSRKSVLNIHWQDMMKLKLQYFGHLMWRIDSLKKSLMLGKLEGRRRRGWQSMRLTRWTWVWASSGNWWWTGKTGMLQSMGSQRVGHDWTTEVSWTELKTVRINILFSFSNNIASLREAKLTL